MHSYHPDIHDSGLQDNCSECLNHAENPFSTLDRDMLSGLIILALDMRDGKPYRAARSFNEGIARKNIMDTLERMGRALEVTNQTDNLDRVIEYYRRYWRVTL